MSDDPAHYDVIVIGGALSGAATATLLLRNNPGIRVLIIERTETLGRRVGEATVEVSAYFLGRILGLTRYLNEHHLVKQGLRFWFKNDDVRSIGEASEIGPKFQVRLPSYQIDRATLDEEVLRRACAAGASLLRPATVREVTLHEGGRQEVVVQHGEKTLALSARWVVDASGVAAMLARKNGWWVPNAEHPTASAWSRWKGVKDWDSREFIEKYPELSKVVFSVRGTATNHAMGDGWWSWWIPLKGGDMSVGVVFDQRLVDWPSEGGSVGERLKAFLLQHPVAREMLADAKFDEHDVHWRKNLAYVSTTFCGDGFVLVGDAAAFMDPFYSPGMDWISYTTFCAAALITAQRHGEAMPDRIRKHNADFTLSYRSWFEAVYKNKYEYVGEWDLMNIAFELDLGLYYLGVVYQPFTRGEQAFCTPPFTSPPSRPVFHFMKFYNARLAKIARRRRQTGSLGKSNRLRRRLIPSFQMRNSDFRFLLGAVWRWAKLELREGLWA